MGNASGFQYQVDAVPMAPGPSQASASGASSEREALSVSAALAIAKSIIGEPTFRIVGEVSELSDKPGYKAVYFTIKDPSSTLPCMIWKNRYTKIGIPLRLGMRVEVTGKFSIFAPKGRMNFDVSFLSNAGEGDLRMQIAALANKLKGEGLMDVARKRPVPPFPERIGVVTSPRGAAVHDVLRTLRRRFPVAEVLVAGVPVEGKDAPHHLIEGLSAAAAAGAEVILLVRGGGSFEDLLPFSDEALARAVAACPVPVVTGIGHEPDTSIADMVADVHAITPTAAAEAVTPDLPELDAQLLGFGRNMAQRLSHRLSRSAVRLDALASRPVLSDPLQLFATDQQLLDIWQASLERNLVALLPGLQEKLGAEQEGLDAAMTRVLARAKDSEAGLEESFKQVLKKGLVPYEQQVALIAARVNDLSPLSIMERGWSIARDEKGHIIQSAAQAPVGSTIEVQFNDGSVQARVEQQSVRPQGTEENAIDVSSRDASGS